MVRRAAFCDARLSGNAAAAKVDRRIEGTLGLSLPHFLSRPFLIGLSSFSPHGIHTGALS